MNLEFLTLPIMALLLGGVSLGYALLESRAFDRKWGRHPRPGE